MKNLPKIFVSIASYRDPECQYTVKDLFEKALHPERITVGICWQYDNDEDRDCFLVPAPYPNQVRARHFALRDSQGGCWARAQAHALLEDEDYVLQIDAHMRFVQGWDDALLRTLNTCFDERAGLTGSMPGYWPPDELEIPDPTKRRMMTVHELGKRNDPQLIHMGSISWGIKGALTGLMPTPFIIGNFLLLPAEAVRQVPYDPYIYFRGQEPAYAARLWTHGWNMYQSLTPFVYHFWGSTSRAVGSEADYKKMNIRADLGKRRVRHLLMGDPAPQEALIDIEKYGMGTERTLAQFWKFAGVDLEKGVIQRFANKGRWDLGDKF